MLRKLVRKFVPQYWRQLFWERNTIKRIIVRDARQNWIGRIFPLKPFTINLLVNDICNSRCQTCTIWKNRRDREYTPDELRQILRDPLFSNVRHIGVSGGEPTLRRDLPEIFSVLVNKQPKIRGTGLITNAIQRDQVIQRIVASASVCRRADVPFNVMVSLDGIGAIHDQIRGRDGNFDSAVSVLRFLRDETDIPISIGCTVSKNNVWHVDEVLDFCRQEGIYGRFRVAEFINRLNNEGQTEFIRNFSDEERYHLGLFFAKLAYTYEKSPTIKRTYDSIRNMLIGDGVRLVGCPYRSQAVTLDSRGQLLYCAPKSPILGDCKDISAQRIYRANLGVRRRIIRENCSNCIHDYHADETVGEWMRRRAEIYWKEQLSLRNALESARSYGQEISISKPIQNSGDTLIIGWYGTETAGDKAILGGIIQEIKLKNPGGAITLASIYPYLSYKTVSELGFPEVEVIPTYSKEFWRATAKTDYVVMGGGPLMHLEQLGFVLRAFVRAKAHDHHTRIAGCGIGPLDRGEIYVEAVRQILRFADVIELRDSNSVAWAQRETGREDIRNSGDFAEKYVRSWKQHDRFSMSREDPFLSLYLRDWTKEYQGDLSDKEFEQIKLNFERKLGTWIHRICTEHNLRPRLLPMHHFCIGNDDRDFNRRFANEHLEDLDPIVEIKPLTIDQLLSSMVESRFCICMRFHSVLFANTLGVPFLAIDYTEGGKIAGYLEDEGKSDRMISITAVAAGRRQPLFDIFA